MTDRELMQQALDALEAVMYGPEEEGVDYASNAIDALRERLAQPEPPPECKTEEEKTAFAFGYWKAVEAQRLAQPDQGQKPPVKTYCGGKPNYCTSEGEERTKENIIKLARMAGCHDNGEEFRFVEFRYLERFAALVAAAEREACAKLCDELDAMNWSDFGEYASGYADEIRKRGKS